MNNTMFTNADRRGTNNKEENKMNRRKYDKELARVIMDVNRHERQVKNEEAVNSYMETSKKLKTKILERMANQGVDVEKLKEEHDITFDGDVQQEEEKEMERVSILDRFAAHHSRDVEEEVVVEVKKEEEVEMMSSEEMMAEVFKDIEEKKEEVAEMKERKKEEKKVARDKKKAALKVKTSSLFGFVKDKAGVAKEKVVEVVDEKVEDFLFASLNEESPAPVEEEEVEEKGGAEVKGEEVVAEAKAIFNSIMEKKDTFFAEHSLKPAFKSAAPVVEEEEEEVDEVEEIDPVVEDIMNKLRAELIEHARLEKELEKVSGAQAKVSTLEQQIEDIKSQINFLNSQDKAEEAGVPEEKILRTKEDIDAYFMGQ